MLKRAALLVCSLTACTSGPPQTQLSDLKNPTFQVHAYADSSGTNKVEITLIASDCFSLADDVTVEVNGMAGAITQYGDIDHGYYGDSCLWPAFTVEAAPPLTGFTSSLAVADGSAKLRMDAQDMLTNDLATTTPMVSGRTLGLVWPSASTIDFASATFYDGLGALEFSGDGSALSVTGHALDLAVPEHLQGTGTLKVNASRKPAVARCEGGLTSCSLSLTVQSELTLTVQNP